LAAPVVTIEGWIQRRTEVKKAFVVLCCFVGIAISVGAHRPISGHTADGAEGVTARLQRIADLEAIAALQRCHVNALTTHVFLFDETTAATTLHSIRDLVAFIESFAKDQGYSSARNVPGNVQVEWTGPTTARVQSSTVAAHFPTLGSKSPATDFVEARYVSDVVRGSDGVWRAVEFDLVVQQIWRGVGVYPFAQP
jgi:hypothetical protein